MTCFDFTSLFLTIKLPTTNLAVSFKRFIMFTLSPLFWSVIDMAFFSHSDFLQISFIAWPRTVLHFYCTYHPRFPWDSQFEIQIVCYTQHRKLNKVKLQVAFLILYLFWLRSPYLSFSSRLPSKHFNVALTLFLGWYDVATSHSVKSTSKQRCVRQRWTTSNQRCPFQRLFEQR